EVMRAVLHGREHEERRVARRRELRLRVVEGADELVAPGAARALEPKAGVARAGAGAGVLAAPRRLLRRRLGERAQLDVELFLDDPLAGPHSVVALRQPAGDAREASEHERRVLHEPHALFAAVADADAVAGGELERARLGAD